MNYNEFYVGGICCFRISYSWWCSGSVHWPPEMTTPSWPRVLCPSPPDPPPRWWWAASDPEDTRQLSIPKASVVKSFVKRRHLYHTIHIWDLFYIFSSFRYLDPLPKQFVWRNYFEKSWILPILSSFLSTFTAEPRSISRSFQDHQSSSNTYWKRTGACALWFENIDIFFCTLVQCTEL